MPTVNSIRHYAVGRFGELGYAVPYFPKDRMYTNNAAIKHLADSFGRLLFAVMHMPDVHSTVPPKLRWLVAVHKAVLRFRTIVAGEEVLNNEIDRRTVNVNPAPEPFLIIPVPYFRVRNAWARRWCNLALMAL